ncbi:hypothetical protein [Streptomyces sp. NPDC086023]|uniref:hypothetical protein n=1 Tax=Streptomyces sp. NPDC086023 TaxID=3365746 RepID=UPI0037D1A3B7
MRGIGAVMAAAAVMAGVVSLSPVAAADGHDTTPSGSAVFNNGDGNVSVFGNSNNTAGRDNLTGTGHVAGSGHSVLQPLDGSDDQDYTAQASVSAIGALGSGSIPAVNCPQTPEGDPTYMNDTQYNSGSGWRITPGVEFTATKGLDFAMQAVGGVNTDSTGYATGITPGVGSNTYTNWSLSAGSFTVTLHCTTNINDIYKLG